METGLQITESELSKVENKLIINVLKQMKQ